MMFKNLDGYRSLQGLRPPKPLNKLAVVDALKRFYDRFEIPFCCNQCHEQTNSAQ